MTAFSADIGISSPRFGITQPSLIGSQISLNAEMPKPESRNHDVFPFNDFVKLAAHLNRDQRYNHFLKLAFAERAPYRNDRIFFFENLLQPLHRTPFTRAYHGDRNFLPILGVFAIDPDSAQ
jgi:hypothetical protein